MENKYSRDYLIGTGTGLQDVDGIKNSSYFIAQSKRYVNGEITLSELDKIITSYYESSPDTEEDNKEADLVSQRIATLLSDDSFSLSYSHLLSIHKYLFNGVLPHAGELRKYEISKSEWVLDGDSVTYGTFRDLDLELLIHFNVESHFYYGGLTNQEIVEHLAWFVSNLWQKHPFGEGNTRTTAVFFIKYLRSLGFDVTNDLFSKKSLYFRNALVRANYNNVPKKIVKDESYLIKFLNNLLFNTNYELSNKDLRVAPIQEDIKADRNNRIIGLMKENPKIKTDEIASMLHISTRTVKSLISVLKENGDIERINGKQTGYWKVNK